MVNLKFHFGCHLAVFVAQDNPDISLPGRENSTTIQECIFCCQIETLSSGDLRYLMLTPSQLSLGHFLLLQTCDLDVSLTNNENTIQQKIKFSARITMNHVGEMLHDSRPQAMPDTLIDEIPESSANLMKRREAEWSPLQKRNRPWRRACPDEYFRSVGYYFMFPFTTFTVRRFPTKYKLISSLPLCNLFFQCGLPYICPERLNTQR